MLQGFGAGRYVCALAGCVTAAGLAAAHVNFGEATVTATTSASSNLVTTSGSNTLDAPGGAGAFPNWQGFSDAGQTIGLSSMLASSDFTLFLNAANVIANGFANARVTPGADFVSGAAGAESRIEIEFHVHGAHHYTIHSVDVNQLNGTGTAILQGPSGEAFHYEGLHIHEVRGELPEGDYTLVLLASSASEGGDSVGFFELEFEVFEGVLCPADINGDRVVDDADFVEFAEAYNELLCPEARHGVGCPADLNGDDVVDDLDFVLFAGAYNALLCD
ncbi:MAG: hypothetical protein JSS51_07290 [Planctomycetes bacterium]|nr:hypothetical protein [Planctomycetota bacterium]